MLLRLYDPIILQLQHTVNIEVKYVKFSLNHHRFFQQKRDKANKKALSLFDFTADVFSIQPHRQNLNMQEPRQILSWHLSDLLYSYGMLPSHKQPVQKK